MLFSNFFIEPNIHLSGLLSFVLLVSILERRVMSMLSVSSFKGIRSMTSTTLFDNMTDIEQLQRNTKSKIHFFAEVTSTMDTVCVIHSSFWKQCGVILMI